MVSYKYLLFDLDNTLFNFEKAEEKSLKLTFDEFQIPHTPGSIEAYFDENHKIWQEFEQGLITQDILKSERFKRFSERINVSFDSDRAGDYYLNELSLCTELIDGAEELIKSLHGKYELILITNGLKVVQRPKIRRSPIGHFFSYVFISEEMGLAKPDPLFFDLVFSELNIENKREALIIGDSLSSDIAGGCNYGIDTCWFNPENKNSRADCKPTYEIHALSEFPEIL